MIPPFDPNEKPPGPSLDPTGRQSPEPEVRYVAVGEAEPEDRMTLADHMAAVAGIGCALTVRFLLIAAAVGIIIGLIFLVHH